VPAGFRFSLKASRKITHFTRLKPESADPTGYLVETAAALGARLGTLLFQLPPNFKADVERLAAFLELIPEGTPAAFEFRHDSWRDEAVHGLLRERNVALVCADTGDSVEDEAVVATTDWGYLRLRRPGYGEDDLARWAEIVTGQEWSHAFVFFKHEEEGAGPRMAERFRELVRQPRQ